MSDTSSGAAVYAQANKPTVPLLNPLDAYAKAGQIAQGMNANKLFQAQTMQGQAYQNAIDPDGTFNQSRYQQNLQAAGPGAAQGIAEAGQAGQTLAGNAQDQALQRAKYINQQLPSLINLPPDQIHQGLIDAMNRGRAMGIGDANSNLKIMSQFSHDPAVLRQQLIQIQTGNQGPEQQQQTTAGRIGTATGPGGVTIGTTQNPNTGAISSPQQPGSSAGVTLGVDPATAGAPVKWTDNKGVEHNTTWAEYNTARGNGQAVTAPTVAPGAPPGTGRPAPLVPAQAGNGAAAPPPATASPPAQSTPVQSTPARPQLTDTTGPAPGSVAPAAADGPLFTADRNALPTKQTGVQNLQHAYQALQLTSSGKSSESTHALFGYLQANGLLPAGATDELKNYELFRKYTERNVADLGNQAGTDAGRSLAAQSNAGTSLSTPANQEVLANDIAKQRQAIAITRSAPDQTNGQGYGAHTAKMSAPDSTDVRGFRWDMYSQQEKAAILKSVKPGSPQDLALHRAIGMASKFSGMSTDGQ